MILSKCFLFFFYFIVVFCIKKRTFQMLLQIVKSSFSVGTSPVECGGFVVPVSSCRNDRKTWLLVFCF